MAARYELLSKQRAALLAKFGDATQDFEREYADAKRALVGQAALEAAGCKR